MTDALEAGAVVDGRFELEERIDSGGLATVWRATDRERGHPVAVKCENVGDHGRAQVRAHFRQELRWFRRFEDGPTPGSLVQFVEGAVRDDAVYVATELIDGAPLASAVGTETTPGLEAVRALAGPVCRALGFLHRHDVLHLDVKPGNVLCRRRGPPAVIDLNSAVSRSEGTGTLFHHDPYKPPELTPTEARDEPAGPWSDVYALGKLLYFLLTGETVAFDDQSLSAWEAVDPHARGLECPPGLADVVRRATAPRPDDRFVDADALYASLVPFLDVSDRSARLVHESSGRTVRVHDGTTIGRWTPDRRVPSVVVPDDERFVCPEHATIEREGGEWVLRDRSLNGTYVRTAGRQEYVLSPTGRERRREEVGPLPRADPAASIRLSDGDRITPVSPRYGCPMVFRTDW